MALVTIAEIIFVSAMFQSSLVGLVLPVLFGSQNLLNLLVRLFSIFLAVISGFFPLLLILFAHLFLVSLYLFLLFWCECYTFHQRA